MQVNNTLVITMARQKITMPKMVVKRAWKESNQTLAAAAEILEVSPTTARNLLVEAGCIKAGENLKRGRRNQCPPSPGKRKLKRVFKECGWRKNATAEVFGINRDQLEQWLNQHDLQP